MNSYSKKKIISLVAPFISGLKVHKLFESGYAGLGHILTFHRVIPPSGEDRIHNHLSLEICPKQLEATIRFYQKKGYEFISLDQLYNNLQSKKKTDRFVVFTFDDGYKDNFTEAYPILKKYSIPFTIYVTTNFPDYKAILWWYLLEDTVRENDTIRFEWKNKKYQYQCKTTSSKEGAFDKIRFLINQSFNSHSHLKLLTLIFNKTESQLYEYSKSLAMSWTNIKKLSEDRLCTIGAHTVNHFPLSQLDQDQLFFEIKKSKEIIENHIGKPVQHFAYPFGKLSEASYREFEVVKSLGFKTATTTRTGNIFETHKNSTECLPRISVNKVTNENVLTLQSSGFLPFIIHRGKKVITN